MPIIATCACGKKFAAKDEHAGMRAKCPSCGQVLTIPAGGPAAEPPPAAPARPTPAARPTPVTRPTPAPAKKPVYEGRPLAHWLDAFKGDDAAARKQAVDVLGRVGAEATIETPTLVEHLQDANILVRHWAAVCLKQVGAGAKEAIEPLFKACLDEQPLIREKAAQALGAILPGASGRVAGLLAGLNDKKAEKREQAVEDFRREARTTGVSRCRFWMCSCGSVFEKEGLEDRLKQLAAGDAVAIDGARTCKKCGKHAALADVFAGQFDVPPKFWPQLEAKFGKPVQLAAEVVSGAARAAGGADREDDYGIAVGDGHALPESAIEPAHISGKLAFFAASDDTESYGVGDSSYHAPMPVKFEADVEREELDLTPGGKVPVTGKYRCTSCGKARLKPGKGGKTPPKPEAPTVKQFKEGKAFPACPNCDDMTEWELLKE